MASLLDSQPDLSVVGEAASAPEAIELARKLQPDLVLLDLGLPPGNGLDAMRAILADRPETNIVFLTVHEEDEMLFAAIRGGAKGYLLKNTPIAKLLPYLRGIELGEAAITPLLARRILDEFSRTRPSSEPDSSLGELTGREAEVLRELSTGATNSEIAKRLVISERTVKNHVSHILSKLHLQNRREAIRFARGREPSGNGSLQRRE
jgi:NarL family two-component system response regulator LiaR